MSPSPSADAVFGHLTWVNYRNHRPTDLAELRSSSIVTNNPFAPTDEQFASTTKWYALLMEAVHTLTHGQKSGFPARLYAHPGQIVPAATWTNEIRTDLLNELFEHLYSQNVDSDIATGNQFTYILGKARTIAYVKDSLVDQLTRVLRHRFSKNALSHIQELIWDFFFDDPFIDCGAKKDQQRRRPMGLENVTEITGEPTPDQFGRAVSTFATMKRNKVAFGVTNADGTERFPRLYNSETLKKAVTEIITTDVAGPVTFDFLAEALEKALVHLDTVLSDPSESRDQAKSGGRRAGMGSDGGDEDFDEFDVPGEEIGDLQADEGQRLDANRTFVGEEVGVEVKEMMAEMRTVLSEDDLVIMKGKAYDLSRDEIASAVGANNVKAIDRRMTHIRAEVKRMYQENPESLVEEALRHLVIDVDLPGAFS